MKRVTVILVLFMLLSCIKMASLAADDVRGVRYQVNITMPAGHDHIYLYDQPSSSNGKNLGRINNGEYVTGIFSVERKGYTWIYCDYSGIEGYIRKNNLVKVSGGSGSSNKSKVSDNSSSISPDSKNGNVSFYGDVNVRTGPGLDYDTIGTVIKGQTLTYSGEMRTDDRGVAWYCVNFKNRRGWVSSKYASLHGTDKPGNKTNAKSGVEISGYYKESLKSTAKALGLNTYEEDWHTEIPYQYSNSSLRIGGYDTTEYMSLTGSGYTVYGVGVEMDKETVRSRFISAGLSICRNEGDYMSFEHPSYIKSPDSYSAYDGIIDVSFKNGFVVSISWSSYTN